MALGRWKLIIDQLPELKQRLLIIFQAILDNYIFLSPLSSIFTGA